MYILMIWAIRTQQDKDKKPYWIEFDEIITYI